MPKLQDFKSHAEWLNDFARRQEAKREARRVERAADLGTIATLKAELAEFAQRAAAITRMHRPNHFSGLPVPERRMLLEVQSRCIPKHGEWTVARDGDLGTPAMGWRDVSDYGLGTQLKPLFAPARTDLFAARVIELRYGFIFRKTPSKPDILTRKVASARLRYERRAAAYAADRNAILKNLLARKLVKMGAIECHAGGHALVELPRPYTRPERDAETGRVRPIHYVRDIRANGSGPGRRPVGPAGALLYSRFTREKIEGPHTPTVPYVLTERGKLLCVQLLQDGMPPFNPATEMWAHQQFSVAANRGSLSEFAHDGWAKPQRFDFVAMRRWIGNEIELRDWSARFKEVKHREHFERFVCQADTEARDQISSMHALRVVRDISLPVIQPLAYDMRDSNVAGGRPIVGRIVSAERLSEERHRTAVDTWLLWTDSKRVWLPAAHYDFEASANTSTGDAREMLEPRRLFAPDVPDAPAVVPDSDGPSRGEAFRGFRITSADLDMLWPNRAEHGTQIKQIAYRKHTTSAVILRQPRTPAPSADTFAGSVAKWEAKQAAHTDRLANRASERAHQATVRAQRDGYDTFAVLFDALQCLLSYEFDPAEFDPAETDTTKD